MIRLGLLSLGLVAFLSTGAGSAWADDHHDGFTDSHHQYHHYSYYHNHRGYWDQRNGVRIWINI